MSISVDALYILHSTIREQAERIAELEAQQRWIPVGERLPEYGVWVIIDDGRHNGKRPVIQATLLPDKAGSKWEYLNAKSKMKFISVKRWMPLPSAPDGGEG